MSKTVAVAMIVRNEEVMLERCLQSAKEADELVICDTGSTDRTIEIAKQYTDKVFIVPQSVCWTIEPNVKPIFNFAQARNYAKNRVKSDWILSIDADETLSSPFANVRLLAENGLNAVNCNLIAEDNGQSNLFPRLFRNSPHVYWDGAAHNHLTVLGEDVMAPGPNDSLVHVVYGYSPAHFQDADRTLRILEREVRINPSCTRERFYLGREYFYRRRYEDVVVTIGQYVQMSNFLSEKAEAFLMMARAYWEMRMANDARDACVQAVIINPNFKEACDFMAVLAGEGRGNQRWEENARQWRQMAATATNRDVLFVRS
jgi:glycosyltransferase involved in cell wall biosynthesis